jgi:hypothetical protein
MGDPMSAIRHVLMTTDTIDGVFSYALGASSSIHECTTGRAFMSEHILITGGAGFIGPRAEGVS